MRHLHLAAFMLVTFTISAGAQDVGFKGKWSGPLAGLFGYELITELVLNDSSGTFRMFPPVGAGRIGKNNPCLGREFPVVVVSKSPSDLILNINGSQVMGGCIDLGASLKIVNTNTLEGSLTDGRVLKFSRQ